MNAFLNGFGGSESIFHLGVWGMFLLKTTAILAAAWLVHLLLIQANPRWRVLLWRVTAVSLAVLLAVSCLAPAFKIKMPHPVPVVEIAPAMMVASAGEPYRDSLQPSWVSPNLMEPLSQEPFEPNLSDSLPLSSRQSGKTIDLIYPLLAVWLGGVVVLLVRLWHGHRRVSALSVRAQGDGQKVPEAVLEECRRVARAIGCRRRVEVVQSPKVASPFLLGFRRSRLLLPSRMCEEAYRGDLPGILAHELAHVRYHDVAWNVGLHLVSILLWFHPLAWQMRKAHLAACELVSDAVSAELVGDVAGYCRTLARVAIEVCGPIPTSGIAMARTSTISRRLSVLRAGVFTLPLRRRKTFAFGFATLLSAAVLGTLQFVLAEPTAEEKSENNKAQLVKRAGPFAIKLPNGAMVEVLGVSEHPSEGKKWWKPDGSLLAKPPYDSEEFRGRVHPDIGEATREVVYRSVAPQDQEEWFSACLHQTGSSTSRALPGNDSREVNIQAAVIKKGQSTVSLHIEYAVGEWTTHHVKGRDDGESAIGTLAGSFIISTPTEKEGAATLSVTHDLRQRYVRIVAIDLENNQPHYGNQYGCSAGKHLNSRRAEFPDLPLEKVKEFRIQSRPKRWVEIRNISVQPDKKTQIEIVKSEGPLVEPAKGISEEAEEKTAEPEAKGDSKKEARKTIPVEGVVVDPEGRPVAGVSLQLLLLRKQDPIVQSDASGRFRFDVEVPPRGRTILARLADGSQQAFYRFPWVTNPKEKPREPVRLTLRPARVIDVSVVDGESKPVSGAFVGASLTVEPLDSGHTDRNGKCTLRVPAEAPMQNVFALKSGFGLDYVAFKPKDMASLESGPSDELEIKMSTVLTLDGARTVQVKLLDPEGKPMAGAKVNSWYFQKPRQSALEHWNTLNVSGIRELTEKTDVHGLVRFDWLPAWNTDKITFSYSPPQEYCLSKRIEFDPKGDKKELTARLVRTVLLGGKVRFPDGRLAADLKMTAIGAGYQTDRFRQSVQTDADGSFEFHAYPDQFYMIEVENSEWAGTTTEGIVLRPDKPINDVEIVLQPACKIYGQVTVGPDMKPWAGQSMRLWREGPEYHKLPPEKQLPNPTHRNRAIIVNFWRHATTDTNGRYEFHVGPGTYNLKGPDNAPTKEVTVTKEKSLQFDLHAPRPNRGVLSGRVVLQGDDSKPVADAKVYGVARSFSGRDFLVTTDSQGRFRTKRSLNQMFVQAKNKDGTLGGMVEITGDDEEITIEVQPTTSAEGRLLDGGSGKPLADRKIECGVRVYGVKEDGTPLESCSVRFGSSVKTDADGHFKITGLIIGAEYHLSTPLEGGGFTAGGVSKPLGQIAVKEPKPISLGDLQLSTAPHPYRPPTFDEQVAKTFFDKSGSFQSCLDATLKKIQSTQQRVLILFTDPKSEAYREYYQRYFDSVLEELQIAIADYRLLAVDSKSDQAEETVAFLKTRFGVDLSELDQPALLVIDADGKLLASEGASAVSKADSVDRKKLLAFLKKHAPEHPDAETLLAEALAQAKRDNKRVLVYETAGVNCRPCHRLARFLKSQEAILSPDYVVVKIDRWRYPHGGQVLKRLRPDRNGSIPRFVILDSDGTALINSDSPEGNIGFPSAPKEIDYFMKMIKTTAQRITPEELDRLRESLETGSTK